MLNSLYTEAIRKKGLINEPLEEYKEILFLLLVMEAITKRNISASISMQWLHNLSFIIQMIQNQN